MLSHSNILDIKAFPQVLYNYSLYLDKAYFIRQKKSGKVCCTSTEFKAYLDKQHLICNIPVTQLTNIAIR